MPARHRTAGTGTRSPGALLADLPGQQPGPVAAVEGSDLRPGLTEARIVRGHGQVAHDVQDVPAPDRVAGDHRDDRLGQTPDLDLQVQHVQPPDALGRYLIVADVAVVAADLLVTSGAERPVPGAGQDDHTDGVVVAGQREGALEFEQGLRAERIALVGTVDGDLRDSVGGLVTDVAEVPSGFQSAAGSMLECEGSVYAGLSSATTGGRGSGCDCPCVKAR